jgi:competence protein ComEC
VWWRGWTAENDRRPLWLPVALGAGAALYFALPVEPSAALGWGMLAAAAVLTLLAVLAGWARTMLALAAALALGFGAAKLREADAAAPVLQQPMTLHLTARIAAVETGDAGTRLLLADPVSGGFAENGVPRRLRVTVRVAGDFTPGDWISLTARLSPPSVPAMPGAADFARAAWFESVGGSGFSFGLPDPAMAPRAATFSERISDGVAALRWRMTKRIRAALPGSEGAVAASLITGMRGGIAQDDAQALRDAGLAHVLSISGLHMVLMGMGLFWLVRALLAASPYLALHYPIKKWAAAVALGGAGFYLVLSGAASPAVRAFLMLAVGLVAVMLDRPALSLRGLGVAAAAILLWRPESITDPGFQMSFAAVAALLSAAEADAAPGRGAWARARGVFTTSAVASLATLPFALFHFGRAAHYAVLANLITMPVVGFLVMPFAALSVAALPFGLEALPLQGLGWSIGVMLDMGHWVAALPGAAAAAATLPLAALLLLVFGGLWLMLWQGAKRWLGLAPLAAAIMVAMMARGPDLLVAPDAATVAVRAADGRLYFIGVPSDRFAAREWLRRDGDTREAGAATGLGRCDGQGCAVDTQAGLVVVSRRPEGLAEDCARAAILVSAASARCAGPKLVMDGARAAHDQGYAIRFMPELNIETVREWRGERPWTNTAGSIQPAFPAP